MNYTIQMKNILIPILLFTAFQANSQIFIGKQKDINQILENTRKFSEYVMKSDYEGIANSYTADAKLFPNNTKILTSRDSIVSYWTLPEGIETTFHKIIQSEIRINGNEAYDYGYYKGKTKYADGKESSWQGKYVIVWRREKGEWKMYLDIWNRVREERNK
jgi:ketosteroid isomerase-like protein